MEDTTAQKGLASSALKVQTALAERGIAAHVAELPDSTRTAEEAAAAIGCNVAQIVKSLIFQGKESGEPYYVAVSGANRVHEKRLGRLIGEKIRKADAEFTRTVTGFAIGGIPPIGFPRDIKAYIDKDLMTHTELWAAAGTPFAVFGLSPQDLRSMTGGEVVPVT